MADIYTAWPEKFAGQQRDYDMDFLVGAHPVLKPDEDVDITEDALDSDESGRDEEGYMHILNLRPNVKTWTLKYSHMSSADYRYMRGLLMQANSFRISVRGEYNPAATYSFEYDSYREFDVYCRKYGITLRNKKTGDWRNLTFKIIQC